MGTDAHTPDPEAMLTAAVGHIRALLNLLTLGGDGDPMAVLRAQAFLKSAHLDLPERVRKKLDEMDRRQRYSLSPMGSIVASAERQIAGSSPEDVRYMMALVAGDPAQPATCNDALQVGDGSSPASLKTTTLQDIAPINEPRLWVRGYLHDETCRRMGIDPDTFEPVNRITPTTGEGM